MALTEKQKKFVEEYAVDTNATRAYKAVYSNIKNDNTAAAAASRLLKNQEVKEYLKEIIDKVKSERIADAEEVMEYLTSVMRREKKECVVVTLTKEKSEYVPGEDGKLRKHTKKEEIPQVVEIPARLSDANKAAELLGKRYSLFTDKVELDTDMDINITIDYGEADSS
ncbi:MAG: terminase small subunit [Lachnospiraceae bacterium]|nr:terminase small subunit [Lachnospiraceae bacterium]